jgi:pantoate--beta-alanine ligase
METIHTIAWMKQVADEACRKNRILGLVPTMGALHEGHLSLVSEAQKQCSPVVVSVFVNPTQFGPSEDLKKYPRTFDADRAALENLDVDYLFAPTAEEMYPRGFRTTVSVSGLSDKLEGRFRPGHFNGVSTVVLKLFEIAKPRFAFFGRKDAQQVRIIRQMADDLNLDTQIVVCPIIREPDGLAMSSRNSYLKEAERRAATVLYRSLETVGRDVASGERDSLRLVAGLRRVIDGEPSVAIDSAEIVDAETMEPVITLRKTCYVLLAVRIGNTRLIDNALIEQTTDQDGDSFRVSL